MSLWQAGRRAAGLSGLSRGAPAGDRLLLEEQFGAARPLYQLRQAVQAHAAAAGLPGRRVLDMMIAAHELAANAVRHGAGCGRLRIWSQGGALRCQVDNTGPEIAAALKTEADVNVAAEWPVRHSHGLWMIRQLADQMSIVSGPDGTCATVVFTLPA
jgi:anti-sigma regulatory factor (Ser/Thr protein kinase)